jgi:hypothetical protein
VLASFLPASETTDPIGSTQDDISLLWLTRQSDPAAAVTMLESNAAAAGLPSNGADPRTPDIIVQPNIGVVYTGSLKKQVEHRGFAHDDRNVMLLVSNPHVHRKTITSFVETTQVAPTILGILGFDPRSLDAVRKEGTAVLPGIQFDR